MKRILLVLVTLLYEIGIGAGFVSDDAPNDHIGTPSAESYSVDEIRSRVPWDMIINDGKLYIGSGDYGSNTGPVNVWCMDLQNEQWAVSGTLNDEAIGKFICIDGKIYAPGFDSKASSWKHGNYHWLENDHWHTCSQLPDAVHNFDIIQYEDQLFFAIGTPNGSVSPVKKSCDNGISYEDVPFYKNGNVILNNEQYDFTRVYDFFTTSSGLYCVFVGVVDSSAPAYEFYKYSDGAFHYVCDHTENGIMIKNLKQEPVSSKVTYNGSCYIAAWYLSRTDDFQSSEQITLPHNEVAVDLLVDNDRLYVLAAELMDKSCVVRIYAYVYNSFLFPVASFEANNLPASFEKDNNIFYVGMNIKGYDQDITGSIHKITVPPETLSILEKIK